MSKINSSVDNQPIEPNICHKIINQFRIEDLVWSLNLDIDYVNSYLINNLDNEANKKKLYAQCKKAIKDIKAEKINKGEYTKVTTKLIDQLRHFRDTVAIHLADYDSIYEKAQPYILENLEIKTRKTRKKVCELELALQLCHNLYYIRVNDMPLDEKMENGIKHIGEYLAYLGHSYEKYGHVG